MFNFFKKEFSSKELSSQVGKTIINASIATSSDVITISEKASSVKCDKHTYKLMLNENVAYYARIAIAGLMQKRHQAGKEAYKSAESAIFDSICNAFGAKKEEYQELSNSQTRRLAEMYFIKSIDGLSISEQQVYDYADKYGQQAVLNKLPDDQLDIFYYGMRVMRILNPPEGINTVIAHYATNVLIERLFAFQADIKNVM
jgi:hypothetical protein